MPKQLTCQSRMIIFIHYIHYIGKDYFQFKRKCFIHLISGIRRNIFILKRISKYPGKSLSLESNQTKINKGKFISNNIL